MDATSGSALAAFELRSVAASLGREQAAKEWWSAAQDIIEQHVKGEWVGELVAIPS